MTLYGYVRVSTADQYLGLQQAALRAAGCQVIRSEEKPGAKRGGHIELDLLLEFLREGDTLVITYPAAFLILRWQTPNPGSDLP